MAARCCLTVGVLNVGGNVDRAYSGYRGDAVGLQPSAERADGPHIGPAGVGVADLGGEEFEEAVGGAVPSGGDEGWGLRGGKGSELVHLDQPADPALQTLSESLNMGRRLNVLTKSSRLLLSNPCSRMWGITCVTFTSKMACPCDFRDATGSSMKASRSASLRPG